MNHPISWTRGATRDLDAPIRLTLWLIVTDIIALLALCALFAIVLPLLVVL